jgi:hypothetical protein
LKRSLLHRQTILITAAVGIVVLVAGASSGMLSPRPWSAPEAATATLLFATPTFGPTPDKPALEQLLVRYMSQHPPAEFSQLMRNGKTEGYWEELGQVQDSAVQAYIVPALHSVPSTADWPAVVASVYDNGFTRASVLFDGREGQWHTQELPYTTDARVSQALRMVHGERDELLIAYQICGSCSATSIAFDLWRWNGMARERIWMMPLNDTKMHGVLSFDQVGTEPGRTIEITYSSWQQMDAKSRLFAESNAYPHRYFTETWERDGDAFHLTETRVQSSAYNALVEFVAALRSGDGATAKQWATDPVLVTRARALGLDRMPEGTLAFPPGRTSPSSTCHASAIEMCDQWQIEWSGGPRLTVRLVQQADEWHVASIEDASSALPTLMPFPSSPKPTPPPASFQDANTVLERFMSARLAGQDAVVFELLSTRLRDQVMNPPIDVPFLQASNLCWYRYLILQLEQTSPTEVHGRVRVYEHDWAGDVAGGLPQSWEQAIGLVATNAGWRVDELGPEANRAVALFEPHGLTVSACTVSR